MRPVLWGLLGFVLCLPLALVLLIIAAAKYPAMDGLTIKLPAELRTTVAELTLRNAGYGQGLGKGNRPHDQVRSGQCGCMEPPLPR